MAQENFLTVFPTLLHLLLPNNIFLMQHMTAVIHIALAVASLGGSYGILFSNHWNLYTLAQHNHTFFPQLLTKLNRYSLPTVCIVIEALFCIVYLFITQGTVTTLQQISVLGSSIAYTLSVIGLLKVTQRYSKNFYVAWLALGSCMLFVSACVKNLYFNGFQALYFFGIILLFGVTMFWVTREYSVRNNQH